MRATGLVDQALERLGSLGVLTAVHGVRLVGRDGVQIVRVSVPVTASSSTRRLIAQALAGSPYECVDVDTPARGTVHGLTGVKDDCLWRIGTQSEVEWIRDHTSIGRAITSAVPPVFEAYATLLISDVDVRRSASETALVELLEHHSANHSWWLGYLDTGAHDVVFDTAPKVTLYSDWTYVLVEAGPTQAATWREDDPWRGRLPDLIYPADRSWLVSMLWDDDWRCIGGPTALIDAVLAAPGLDARRVGLHEDATPPGRSAV